MDFSSTLKNEIFRPLATIVAPGFIAVGPYFAVAHTYWPTINFGSSNLFLIYLLVIISAGLVLEDIGARIESSIFDPLFQKLNPERDGETVWIEYLKLKISSEYIGQRYLRTIHLRLKFELSMIPSLVVFFIGLSWLNSRVNFVSCSSLIYIFAVGALLWIFLAWEAYKSVSLLSDLHIWIRDAVKRDLAQPQDLTGE